MWQHATESIWAATHINWQFIRHLLKQMWSIRFYHIVCIQKHSKSSHPQQPWTSNRLVHWCWCEKPSSLERGNPQKLLNYSKSQWTLENKRRRHLVLFAHHSLGKLPESNLGAMVQLSPQVNVDASSAPLIISNWILNIAEISIFKTHLKSTDQKIDHTFQLPFPTNKRQMGPKVHLPRHVSRCSGLPNSFGRANSRRPQPAGASLEGCAEALESPWGPGDILSEKMGSVKFCCWYVK